jgi:hypothetical protein
MTNLNTFGPAIPSVNEDGSLNPLAFGAQLAQIQALAKTVPNTRLVNTTAPLTGGGALGGDLTLSITGLSVTITTAALTGGGSQGSMTFTKGVLTAQTPAT